MSGLGERTTHNYKSKQVALRMCRFTQLQRWQSQALMTRHLRGLLCRASIRIYSVRSQGLVKGIIAPVSWQVHEVPAVVDEEVVDAHRLACVSGLGVGEQRRLREYEGFKVCRV